MTAHPSCRSETVEIIGAGPAGLAAAITLASAGRPVVVHERAPDVGWRFHGDLQGIENWTGSEDVPALLSRIGVETNFPIKPFRTGSLVGPDLRPRLVSSPQPLFYVVHRGPIPGSLDTGLKFQAEKLGVQFRFNSHVLHPPPDAIIASGPKSARIIAKGIVFDTSSSDIATGIFSNAAAPKGYSYCLVSDGRGTLATVLYDRFGQAHAYFTRTLQLFERLLGIEIRNPRPFSGHGSFSPGLASEPSWGRHIGESAGLQDALWGFGIKYALVSGYLSGRAILEGVPPSSLWRGILLPGVRASQANRFLFEIFGAAAYRFLVRRLSRAANARSVLHNLYSPSVLKSLFYPLAVAEARLTRHLRQVLPGDTEPEPRPRSQA